MELSEPHTANQICDCLLCYSWKFVDHPPCSPNLMSSDSIYLDPLYNTWLASNLQ